MCVRDAVWLMTGREGDFKWAKVCDPDLTLTNCWPPWWHLQRPPPSAAELFLPGEPGANAFHADSVMQALCLATDVGFQSWP